MKAIIVVHGGAGEIPDSRVRPKLQGVRRAVLAGINGLLKENGSGNAAAEAVCASVASMEADQAFNAGFGSVLNEDGQVEMDAALMDGRHLEIGGVGAVSKSCDVLYFFCAWYTFSRQSTFTFMQVILILLYSNFTLILR